MADWKREDRSESDKTEIETLQMLIRLAAAGACGKVHAAQDIDWPSVMPLAAEQAVVPLVALAVRNAPELHCPDGLREHLLEALRMECSTNLLRRQRILHLLAEMRLAGIDASVLKGYTVAAHYAMPESRGSVDTDLLIDIRQEKAALRFFAAHGFRITPRVATSQHAICQHKRYGEIELHVAPYAELIRDIWFQGMDSAALMQEKPVTIATPDGSYAALGDTDHLIFITLHMVKHFILGGLTLRMMLDIALLFARKRDAIDAARFWDTMHRLRYAQLVNCVLWAMILYGGFQTADFPGCAPEAPEGIAMLLEDLCRGGYMGVKEIDARYVSGMEYNRQVMLQCKSGMEYRLYMLRFKIRSAARHMFPDRKMLIEAYPRAGKHAALLPFLFIYQMVAFPIQKVRAGALRRDIRSESSALDRESQARLDMFRRLGML